MAIKFQCKRCGTMFERELGPDDNEEEVACPKCGAKGPQRVYAAFSIKSSGATGGFT